MKDVPSAFPIEVFPGWTMDMATAFHATAAALLVLLLAAIVVCRLRKVPGRMQTTAELLVSALDCAITRAAGAKSARRYLPLIGTTFLFVLSYHLQGVLRFDAFTWGRFPRSGLEIGCEALRIDLDGNGRADPGDSFDDRNANGHHDRGLLIPHPSMAVWNSQVELAVGLLLAVVIVFEAIRGRRLLAFVGGIFSLRWLAILRELVLALCRRWNVLPVQLVATGAVMVTLTVLGSHYRHWLGNAGLDIPLALIAALTWSVAITLLALAFLGCATGEGSSSVPGSEPPEPAPSAEF